MSLPELDKLEQKLVTLSAERYRRPFYRWGHLLGWFAPVLACLLFIPSLKPYQSWIGGACTLLMFEWYFVLTTRVIGKLQAEIKSGT